VYITVTLHSYALWTVTVKILFYPYNMKTWLSWQEWWKYKKYLWYKKQLGPTSRSIFFLFIFKCTVQLLRYPPGKTKILTLVKCHFLHFNPFFFVSFSFFFNFHACYSKSESYLSICFAWIFLKNSFIIFYNFFYIKLA